MGHTLVQRAKYARKIMRLHKREENARYIIFSHWITIQGGVVLSLWFVRVLAESYSTQNLVTQSRPFHTPNCCFQV